MSDSRIGGESGNGGESGDTERAALAAELEASGHGGCAFDLMAADDIDVTDIAHQVADHVEEACGDTDFAAQPELAGRIRAWANRRERIDPSVARRGKIPVTVHRDGGLVIVNVTAEDLLDLTREGDNRVTLTVEGMPMIGYERIGDAPGGNGQGGTG